MLYSLARPLLFALDAEDAHDATLSALSLLPPAKAAFTHPALVSTIAGLTFPNPVGLAAGFDKNARVADRMVRFGFGSVEVGTVTPNPQVGNPKPRLFRLKEDRAVINRFGFNNAGCAAAAENIAKMRARGTGRDLPVPLGINIGANKDAIDRMADYAQLTRQFASMADYLTVNISSPNTPGLRALQDEGALDELLGGVMAWANTEASETPVFLKVAPDLLPDDIDAIVRLSLQHRLSALIVSNTTITRPTLASKHAGETGGLSGAPLRDMALQRIRDFRTASGGAIPLIGVGGIASADDAYARIRAGASLIQIYSGMVYEGPTLAKRINQGLIERLTRDGISHVAEAVGIG